MAAQAAVLGILGLAGLLGLAASSKGAAKDAPPQPGPLPKAGERAITWGFDPGRDYNDGRSLSLGDGPMGVDTNMDEEGAGAVKTALLYERDVGKLRDFATAISSSPIAAKLLTGKADWIQAGQPQPKPQPQPNPAPQPVPPSTQLRPGPPPHAPSVPALESELVSADDDTRGTIYYALAWEMDPATLDMMASEMYTASSYPKSNAMLLEKLHDVLTHPGPYTYTQARWNPMIGTSGVPMYIGEGFEPWNDPETGWYPHADKSLPPADDDVVKFLLANELSFPQLATCAIFYRDNGHQEAARMIVFKLQAAVAVRVKYGFTPPQIDLAALEGGDTSAPVTAVAGKVDAVGTSTQGVPVAKPTLILSAPLLSIHRVAA